MTTASATAPVLLYLSRSPSPRADDLHKNKLPAYTVGSLQRKSQMDVLLAFIKTILEHQNPADKLKELAELVGEVFQLMPSGKHMAGLDLGCMEPTASTVQSFGLSSNETKFKNLNIGYTHCLWHH